MLNNNLIEELLRYIQELPDINVEVINSVLINYNNRNDINIVELQEKLLKNKSIIKNNNINLKENNCLEIRNSNLVNSLNLSISFKGKNVYNNIEKVIKYINKERISYEMFILNGIQSSNCVIKISNIDEADKLIEFLNKKIQDTNSPLPLYINDGVVSISIGTNSNYEQILSCYIDLYLKELENKQVASISSFYSFVLGHYQNITQKRDLSTYLKINVEKTNQEFLTEFELMTNQLQEVLNRGTKENIYKLYNEYVVSFGVDSLSKVYEEFNNLEENYSLLDKIIRTMLTKYGYDYTFEALVKYGKTNNNNLITRTNNLRKQVMNKVSFNTYVNTIDLKEVVDKVYEQMDLKEMDLTKDLLLENVCKETYLSCQNEEKHYSGKIQVARSLIRMTYGDYNSITRNNNARAIAKENILPDEVTEIIQIALEKNGYIVLDEEDLYELYATHIENIYNKERGILC